MEKDKKIVRELANRYFEIANSDLNHENTMQHRAVNDLNGERPIVLIAEIPWNEMNINNELTLYCKDNFHRELEWHFKTQLFQWKHMRGDMALPPYFNVKKIIHTTGIGVGHIENEHDSNAQSVTYADQLSREEDIEKIHFETITYDKSVSIKRFNRIGELLGDILPIRLAGEETGYGLGCKTMDDIVQLRGLDSFFTDFIDRPEFMHKLIGRFTDVFLDKVRQYNELGLFDGDQYQLHGTAAQTNDLPHNYNHATSKDMWGRGLAQIFASFSPDMHDEFDIQYMIKAMEPFGLCYYGCCEPLDKKIHILKKIPNLRKISITPWADINNAAEIIHGDYVISSKPNPAFLALSNVDEAAVRNELTNIVSACRKNGCCADITLKDITTVCSNPENLFRWHDIAMEIVNNF